MDVDVVNHYTIILCLSREIKECFNGLNSDPDCRVVLLTGAGKNFTAGKL